MQLTSTLAPGEKSGPMPVTTWRWLALLMLCGVCVHFLVLGTYPMTAYPDSGTYVQAARDLISGDFAIGQGRRTPGYPLLIALVGESPELLLMVQMGMGLLIAASLFGITMLVTAWPSLAFAAGLSYLLNLQQLFQEAAMLTETLSTASVAVTLLALIVVLRRLRTARHVMGLSVLLGVLAAYAILVRPQFVFFVPMLPATMLYAVAGWSWPDRRALLAAALVAASASVSILTWCGVMQAKTGYFALSTQSGFGMVNHAIDYIELAPDEFAPARDVLLRTREARIREAGHSRNTIWYAWPEIRRVTGWTLPEASRNMQRMCTAMFVAHPFRYAASVASAWFDFWSVPIIWEPEQAHPAALRTALEWIWRAEHLLLRMVNLAFVLVVVAVIVSGHARRALRWDICMTAIAATVLLSSGVQALFDQGASSRYAIPTQALVVLVVLVCTARAAAGRRVR